MAGREVGIREYLIGQALAGLSSSGTPDPAKRAVELADEVLAILRQHENELQEKHIKSFADALKPESE